MSEILKPEVIVGILFVLILCSILRLWQWRNAKNPRNCILLVGPRGSGKTALLTQIVQNPTSYTVTAMIANVVNYSMQDPNKRAKVLRMCDLPGDVNLRRTCIELYLPNTCGLIFVIDSSTFENDVKSVAQYLFDLLTEAAVMRYRLPVLIACNKQDLAGAASSESVRRSLEAELSVLRNKHLAVPCGPLVQERTGETRTPATKGFARVVKRVFGIEQLVSFETVARVFPTRFADCSTGGSKAQAGGKGSQNLHVQGCRIAELIEWIDSC